MRLEELRYAPALPLTGPYYFAHPLTHRKEDGTRDALGEVTEFELCVRRTANLMHQGYNVFSPIVHSWPVQDYLGHDDEAQLPWYAMDMAIIERTTWDGIILAPHWQNSKGCRKELEWFLRHDLPVHLYTELIGGSDDARSEADDGAAGG